MIDFLYSLNKALNEESDMKISYKRTAKGLIVKVFDFKRKGINLAKVYINNRLVGFTNEKGILEIEQKIPKKAFLRAELGIYIAKKEIIPF